MPPPSCPPALFPPHRPSDEKEIVRNEITHHASRDPLRPFSSILVDGPERAAAHAMLYPVGFTEEDFKKPIIRRRSKQD
jgi:hypothetical protein